MTSELQSLIEQISSCRLCDDTLPLGPRPVVQLYADARVLIAGQAPGVKVHETGIAFNDPSGDRLREWLGVDRDAFYHSGLFALVPMGFCYPGTTPGQGDLPPDTRCAPRWRERVLSQLPKIELTILLGAYAQRWHLREEHYKTVTAATRDYRKHWPSLIALPHPSPRNNLWLKKNPWFEKDVLPLVRQRVADLRHGEEATGRPEG
ncbi:MAG: uracil-DNA glycosylase family protein [Pseudomonadota bacterium]